MITANLIYFRRLYILNNHEKNIYIINKNKYMHSIHKNSYLYLNKMYLDE